MDYAQWLETAAEQLRQANPTENAKLEAALLLQAVSGKSRAQILAFGETPLSEKSLEKLTALLSRRLQGEPMAYVLGEREFWSLSLKVSPHTLIPRPDTESLVESAVEIGKDFLCRQGRLHILDLGTGTGAIALALGAELQAEAQRHNAELRIVGVDKIPEAISLAAKNGKRNGLEFVTFLHSDWFGALEAAQKFDMIVSNPPYIDPDDPHLAQGDVRFEPKSALVAAEKGFADLKKIIENAPHFLAQGGWLLLEHGWQQGEKVRSFFTEKNQWQQIQTRKDYGGRERLSLACLREV